MRTLQLTHEQIELICHALGIAEKQYMDTFTNASQNLVRVRGTVSEKLPIYFLFERSTSMANLCSDIEDSKFDV